jgi:hypothetical protein
VSDVASPWASGAAYEAYVGRWSAQVAPVFLDWLGVPAERGWVDVGCGTGMLTGPILRALDPKAEALDEGRRFSVASRPFAGASAHPCR